MEIRDAVVLVTGGAKGLGLAIAIYLQNKGAQVVVADIDNEALDCLPVQLDRYSLDVTNPDDAETVIKSIVARHDHIDVLVNNAGIIFNEPMVNIMNQAEMMHDYKRFRNSIIVNLDSVFIMTSAVVKQMVIGRTKGCIVNISSICASGNEGQTSYSAAKAGVNAMTVTWSKELGRFGIRCNAVAPGFIDTDSTHNAINDSIVKHIEGNTPLRRLGEDYEVGQAVASLINNNFITGTILNVNGGLTI